MLTITDVIRVLADRGRPIGPKTWTGYVSRGTAPPADRMIGRTPLWFHSTIVEWLTKEDRETDN